MTTEMCCMLMCVCVYIDSVGVYWFTFITSTTCILKSMSSFQSCLDSRPCSRLFGEAGVSEVF